MDAMIRRALVEYSPSRAPLTWKPKSAMGLPITTEGQNGGCAAHAGAYYVAHRNFIASVQYLSFSPRSLYAAAKSIDGKKSPPGTDMMTAFKNETLGTTLPAIAKAIATMGIALNDLFPDDDLDEATYGDYSLMSATARADALTRATRERYFYFGENPSIKELREIIWDYGGLLLLVKTGHEWLFGADLLEADVREFQKGRFTSDVAKIMPLGALLPPSLPATTTSHAIYVPAYDEKNLLFPNSWGPDWGNAGFGALGEDYMPHIVGGLVFEGGVREGRAAEMD